MYVLNHYPQPNYSMHDRHYDWGTYFNKNAKRLPVHDTVVFK